MPTYISLIRFTQKGVETIREGPKRLDMARQAFRDAGAEVKAVDLVTAQEDQGVGVSLPSPHRGPAWAEGEVRQFTPRMALPFPDRRRIPWPPLTTTRDIANESGFLGRPLVQDLRAGTGGDQEFSRRMGHI